MRSPRAGPPNGGGAGEADRIGDQDVHWLLQTAGSYIVEDLGPGGWPVFRPFHDLLAVQRAWFDRTNQVGASGKRLKKRRT